MEILEQAPDFGQRNRTTRARIYDGATSPPRNMPQTYENALLILGEPPGAFRVPGTMLLNTDGIREHAIRLLGYPVGNWRSNGCFCLEPDGRRPRITFPRGTTLAEATFRLARMVVEARASRENRG